jgi:hypothetical protein
MSAIRSDAHPASTVTSPTTPAGAASAPQASVLLARYRARLATLLAEAEAAAPVEPAALKLALDQLVEDLNADLLTVYRAAERGELAAREAAIVVPAFERLRNVLRQRDVRNGSIRDTLHKAALAMPASSQPAG